MSKVLADLPGVTPAPGELFDRLTADRRRELLRHDTQRLPLSKLTDAELTALDQAFSRILRQRNFKASSMIK